MTTDLTTVKDHPAELLDGNDAPFRPETLYDAAYNIGVSDAADFLREYETRHNVTFAALDNDALVCVREEWRKVVDGDPRHDLFGAVRDLLGLGD